MTRCRLATGHTPELRSDARRLWLRCTSCGAVTAGWTLDPPPLACRPRVVRFRARLRQKQGLAILRYFEHNRPRTDRSPWPPPS